MQRPRRADARRNYEQIVAAAEAEIARHGADASLEEIARRAGVGSATLHRHFPARQTLLEAVFHDRVVALCEHARELAADPDPSAALSSWLRAVTVYGAATRGLARSLLGGGRQPAAGRAPGGPRTPDEREAGPDGDSTCEAMLVDAGGALLRTAQQAGEVRPEVTIVDLLTLVNAVSLATEGSTDAATEATRLVDLALDGVRPRDPTR